MGFPIIIVLILSSIGFGIAYSIRKTFRNSKLLLTAILSVLLVPWFMHYNRYLREAERALQEHVNTNKSIPLYIVFASPFLIVLVLSVAIIFSRQIGRLIAALSILSVYINFKVTFPLVHRVVPPFNFDNMPSTASTFY